MTKGILQMWLTVWTLKCWDYPSKSLWAHTNHQSVKGISLASLRVMRLKEEENFRAWGGLNLLSLPLKMKEGATNQETWGGGALDAEISSQLTPSKKMGFQSHKKLNSANTWVSREVGFLLEFPERKAALWYLDFGLVRPVLDFWTSKLKSNKCLWFKPLNL